MYVVIVDLQTVVHKMIKYKICNQCEIKKSLSEYYKHKNYKYGVRAICKKCFSSNGKKYSKTLQGIKVRKKAKEKHRKTEKYKETTKKYEEANRIKKREYSKRYRQSKHGKKIAKAYRKTYKWKESRKKYENSENYKKCKKKYYNSDRGKETIKKYQQTQKYKEFVAKYRIKRMSNPRHRLRKNIGMLVTHRLQARTLNKNGLSSFDFLPYTLEDLIKYLENLFLKNMTWENYGSEWSIDHIIADCKFNYRDINDKEFQKCWELKNLQPMWNCDNSSKSNKDFLQWMNKNSKMKEKYYKNYLKSIKNYFLLNKHQ